MNFQEWFNKTYPYPESLPADYYSIAYTAWKACKKEALEILKKDWTGLDLSINSCDNHYIEKIEKL